MLQELSSSKLLEQLYSPLFQYKVPHLAGASILVTGAGGSIGSVICRELIKAKADHIVMFDIYDGNLSKLQELPLKKEHHRLVVGDIRDRRSLSQAMQKYKPDFIFNAAALKHVPMLEDPFNMIEAVNTNFFGTVNVLRAAMDLSNCGVVNVSTDKAVNPVSILGLTKRCAELAVRVTAKTYGLQAINVRFGNVLDSVGSALPIFRRQIANGGPVTITDDRMTRYFMTTEKAAALTLMASEYVAQGQSSPATCHMFDMGGAIKIVDLVNALIAESGTEQVPIKLTGMRPGEKLHEELHYSFEKKTFAKTTWSWLLEDKSSLIDEQRIDDLCAAVEHRRAAFAARLMRMMVPEYCGDFAV